ncbi:IS66 family transposase [Escherichia coli]|uniref:IS66 family transposase n=1 Tax=Escherichia coli TaxID=562 RepID=UPI0021D6648D|nr:IS66 family transposase [Escherichia coli]MCU7735539.1 IS66 family transposase [Escherichia coli]
MLTGKYCEHLPLYRQSEIFAHQGAELSRALLSSWVDACCQLMTPLNDALYRYVMNTCKLHTDDRPVKVLAQSLKKTKTGRIWIYRGKSSGFVISSGGLVRVLTEPAGETPVATPPPLPGYPVGGCVHRLRQAVQCRT